VSQWVAITVIGEDRPGIVAGVTKVLYDHGCNLEDSSAMRLRDEFAMILIARLPNPPRLAELEAALAATAEGLDVAVNVRDLGERVAQAPPAGRVRGLAVYGADRPGIVYQVSERLAAARCNITDVTTHIAGEVYLLLLEMTVPDAVTDDDLRAALAELRADLAVDITLRDLDEETL
jgi:glycine cleavage system transcriptional repressor